MSALRPEIKVEKLSQITGVNQLTKIDKERKNKKTDETIYPVVLLNFDDGETFSVNLSSPVENAKVGDIVEIENASLVNFPRMQQFGANQSAVNGWSYSGEKLVVLKSMAQFTQPTAQTQPAGQPTGQATGQQDKK